MAIQIFDDGACMRIEKGTKTLLVAKEQVKTIDVVHNNIVRIDIGEGPLKNIFLNYQDVTQPIVGTASGLRDFIKALMYSDNYDGGDAKEETQISILNKLNSIADLLQDINQHEADFTKSDPTRTDESNPNTIYKGWHAGDGITNNEEWAILRIRNVDDEIIYEWVLGNKAKVNVWDNRASLVYLPFDYNGAE